MSKRVSALAAGVVGLALVAVLVIGLTAPVSAFAATKHKPVVKAISPAAGTITGGNTVTITGKYFTSHGKRTVKKVTFGTTRATRVHVMSASKITVTAPAGTGTVKVRVRTTAGRSAKVSAAKYAYRTATTIALKAGDAQSASAGTAVSTAPSVIVTDAGGMPVPGVSVTFAVASGSGSATGASPKTDASGVATVGSWKLGAVAGVNTLTATSAMLAGSPVTFTATGTAGLLQVELNGAPVRSYSLAELKALAPFAGYAGYKTNGGSIVGPDAVTGTKVTDIVKDALGAPLTAAESVNVAEASPYYGSTFSYAQLTDPATGFTMFTTSGDSMTSFTGTLAPVLIYSDPAAQVMSTAKGPLRFFIADTVSETVMMGSNSISNVDQLNVINP